LAAVLMMLQRLSIFVVTACSAIGNVGALEPKHCDL
jgi:hypothetical protein